jgi:type I restriction enzyme S subunit
MINWRSCTVRDLVDEKIIAPPMDGNHGEIHPKGEDFTFNGIPFVMASDINDSCIDFTGCKFISKEQADGLRKGFTEEGDVLLSHKATIGRSAIVPKSEFPYLMLTPQVTYYRVLDEEKLDYRFLKYHFDNTTFQKTLGLWAGAGSTRAYLGITGQHNLPLQIPGIESQRKIGSVLSVIDKKIVLNNKINAELEAMAKLIYDYWFVQFDFPDANGKPYKSSGGKMVYNEALKREIPAGWCVGNIMHLANLLGGGTPKTNVESYWKGSIPFFTPADSESNIYCLKTKENITEKGLDSCSSRRYKKGTVFITARGTVGKINIASCDMAMNQSCYALQGKEGIGSEYVYFYADELIQYVKSKASGSIFKALVTNDFKFTELTIPPRALINQFTRTVESSFEKVLLNKTESQRLSALRDWLLPMLMNGQVTVNDAKY